MMSMAVAVKRLWLVQRLMPVYLMLIVIVVCDRSLSEDFVLDNGGLSEQVSVDHSVVVIAPDVSIRGEHIVLARAIQPFWWRRHDNAMIGVHRHHSLLAPLVGHVLFCDTCCCII